MYFRKMPNLKICDFEARIPIIQGGMGVGVSLSGLASSIANEGGIGVIASAAIGMHEPDFSKKYKDANKRALSKEIRRARELTNGIIGVNIMIACSDFYELALVALDEGADLIFVGAGLLLKIPETLPLNKLRKVHTKIIPIVSSERAARIIFQYQTKNYNQVPEAVVVEGPLAGGHLGFKKEQINDPDYKLENILLKVIAEVKIYEEQYNKNIPVIAAGGIYTGADIHKFIQLGAQGVQMATRFVPTHECDASTEFKEAYVRCKEDDLIIIESPVGLPARAIRNKYLNDVSMGIKKPFKCPWKCLKTCDFRKAQYCIAQALTNAKKGNLDDGFVFAGANAFRTNKIVSVKEVITTLLTEYENTTSM